MVCNGCLVVGVQLSPVSASALTMTVVLCNLVECGSLHILHPLSATAFVRDALLVTW